MADPRRLRRLESLIQETLGPIVSRGLDDPRLHIVTVTRIRLSPDLAVARVNWSCLGSESDRSKARHALEHARGRLQAAVAGALQTRVTPRLEFHYDDSAEKALRVSRILDEIARQRKEPAGGAPPAADNAPDKASGSGDSGE